MGYRAHTITQHREYGNTIFTDWDDFMDFVGLAGEDGLDIETYNDDLTYYEVDKHSLADFANKLPDNDEPSIYRGWSNRELKQELLASVAQTKESYVAWEWF